MTYHTFCLFVIKFYVAEHALNRLVPITVYIIAALNGSSLLSLSFMAKRVTWHVTDVTYQCKVCKCKEIALSLAVTEHQHWRNFPKMAQKCVLTEKFTILTVC